MRKKERSVQGLLEETCKQKDRRILELEKELQESKKGFETLKEAIETLKEVIAMTDYWKKNWRRRFKKARNSLKPWKEKWNQSLSSSVSK